MKSVFEKLYRGEVRPDSIPGPDTDEYRDALKHSNDAQLALLDSLNEEQKKLLDAAMSARAEISYQENVCLYSEGIRFGMRLMLEALIPDVEVGR